MKLDTSTTPGATSQEDAEEGAPLLASQLRWLLQYSQQMDRVSGFFEPQLLHVYWRLFLLQRQLQGANYAHDAKLADSKQCSDRDGLSAAVGEIGVFHGKSFLPLWALRSKGEAAVAIDLFEGRIQLAVNSAISLQIVEKGRLSPPGLLTVSPSVSCRWFHHSI